jgi:hypothetical protein
MNSIPLLLIAPRHPSILNLHNVADIFGNEIGVEVSVEGK